MAHLAGSGRGPRAPSLDAMRRGAALSARLGEPALEVIGCGRFTRAALRRDPALHLGPQQAREGLVAQIQIEVRLLGFRDAIESQQGLATILPRREQLRL